MSAVNRPTDKKLRRDVAIKVLPAEAALGGFNGSSRKWHARRCLACTAQGVEDSLRVSIDPDSFQTGAQTITERRRPSLRRRRLRRARHRGW